MESVDFIEVEIAYARPEAQVILTLTLPAGATVAQALAQSKNDARFAEIDLRLDAIGIFGRRCEASRVLQDGDRIEIYRPLSGDPKEIRRRRAKRAER